MPASSINDPKHWRDRAAEMRAIAEWIKNPETMAIMGKRPFCRTTMRNVDSGKGSPQSQSTGRPHFG
jgi:hypothetical protein